VALTARRARRAFSWRPVSLWRPATLLFWAISRLVLLYSVVVLGHKCDQVFWTYGHDIAALHLMPYRDFGVEYPPLAAALFAIPGGALDWPHYAGWFAVMMLTADLLTLVFVRYAAETLGLWADGWRAAFSYAVLAFVTSAVLNKYDVAPGLLTLVAVVALIRGRDRAAWVALAAAVLFKGYAVVLAPLFLLYRYRVRRAMPGWQGPLAGALATAVVLLPVIAAAGPAFARTLLFHANRGLEIESVYASVVLVAHNVAHLSVWVTAGKAVTSRDVHSALNGSLETAAPVALVGCLGGAYAAAWARLRREATPEALVLLSMAAITAFTITFKALPSHYLLWLIPLAAVALGRPASRTTGAAVAVLCAVGLGAIVPVVWLPLRHFDPVAVAIMVGRNLALIAVFLLLIRRSLASQRQKRLG